MTEQASPIVEFSAAVYEFARFIAPGQEDGYLKMYLDSQHLAEFPYGTFTDWSPDPSFLLSLPASVTSSMSSVLPSSSISPVAQSASSASSLEQDKHGPANHSTPPNPSPPSILPNQIASNPGMITISQGAVTSKNAYGRGNQSSFATPNAELILHPTSTSSQLQPTRLPPRPKQANHSIIQQISHKLEKGSSVNRLQASRVSKNQGQQKATRASKDHPGSRASRAHFHMLTVHGKLRAGDELRVPICLPSGALDTGVFTYSGNRTGVFSDWMFGLASATEDDASMPAKVKNVTGFEEVYSKLGLQGPLVRKWSDAVRVFRGGMDMGSVMEFKDRELFDD